MDVCRVCALERDMSLFPHGDKTVVGERGVSLSGGQRARINLARAVYKMADIYLLDDPLSAVDTQVAKHIFEKCIKTYLQGQTVILVTHQIQFLKFVDQIIILDHGTILLEGNYEHFKDEGLDIARVLEEKTDDVIHTDIEFSKSLRQSKSVLSISLAQPSSLSLQRRHWSLIFDTSVMEPPAEAEFQATGRVQGSVYKEYFRAGAPYSLIGLVAFMFIFSQLCASAGDYWISRWSSVEDQLTGDDTMDNIIWLEAGLYRFHFILIFAIITIATVIVALTRAFLFFSLCMRSSISLHDKMFECISRSPMSFFHANTSGRILNRFSKDMGSVDELLPQAMIDCAQIMLNLLGVVIVILIIDVTLLIPMVAALIIFYIFRVIYVRTSSAIKRLEGITRSPVFGHINATILGLATIRSFEAEEMLTVEFDRHQDLHSSAWYLFITCSRAFGFFLDIICLLFIVCVTFGCLIHSGMDGSIVGLAITQSISLTGVFQWGMRQSAEMENQMTSVERVLEYTRLRQEPEWISAPPPPDWPKEGQVSFQNLCFKYSPDANYVLNKISLIIEPRQKIGIVGRTGAGKSSVIQALFRLGELEGIINIDGIDITTIGLHDLRSTISIIPQEPVLFSGAMRKNLDPFDDYPDETLLNALENVKLTAALNDDALSHRVLEGGINFSVGQRQLVCLARAIVRHNRILVLDEATANVDAQTDSLIQNTIRTHFEKCTVLTIAHRLNTIIDSDKVMVLDAGHLVEYDHPYNLLQIKRGYFSKMIDETGPSMAGILRRTAEENYNTLLNDTNRKSDSNL